MTGSRSTIPKGIHQKNGRYYRVLRNRWIGLSRVEEGLAALRAALRELDSDGPVRTVGDLLRAYSRDGMSDLAPETQREYRRIIDVRLDHHFGRMTIPSVTQSHVSRYLEKRRKAGRGVMGNRERAVLSSAFDYGMRNGHADVNPCQGIRRNKEKPRDRYVKDAEFLEAFDAAPEPLQDAMALGLLTAARQGELRALRLSDMHKEGLCVYEGKTRKLRVVKWSPALRFFVTRAVERKQAIAARPADPRSHRQKRKLNDYLLTNRFGEPWTLAGIQTAFKRLGLDWHFHDIRAKAQSDTDENITGHGAGMLSVYARRNVVKALR